MVLTVDLAKGWSIRQLDINNTFLLKEDICMEQPASFQQLNTKLFLVCKPHKAIYWAKINPLGLV